MPRPSTGGLHGPAGRPALSRVQGGPTGPLRRVRAFCVCLRALPLWYLVLVGKRCACLSPLPDFLLLLSTAHFIDERNPLRPCLPTAVRQGDSGPPCLTGRQVFPVRGGPPACRSGRWAGSRSPIASGYPVTPIAFDPRIPARQARSGGVGRPGSLFGFLSRRHKFLCLYRYI